MKKIDYPKRGTTDFTKLLSEYKDIYQPELANMEQEWDAWKNRNNITTIPENIADLLIADVDVISDVYERFKALGIPVKVNNVRNPLLKELDSIFRYVGKYDDKIATFFQQHAELLHISTCSYCELAYVNIYTLRYPRNNCVKNRNTVVRRQFDVDHFMPKSECPILGLSLFNFIPSCQVCNSRIKRNNVLGKNKQEWRLFNPAGENYSLDDNVKIHLQPKTADTGFTNPANYQIYFRCHNRYRSAVDFFHLEERYEFHKIEALRLCALKTKYPKSTIKRIAALLKKSESEITEDIFHKKFLMENNRCFAKLTRDILM